MNADQLTIQRLSQSNRLLKLGYLVLAVVVVVGYSLLSPEPSQAHDRHGDNAVVDANQVGDAQLAVGVDHPDGFAVVIDEQGKICVVTRDGLVLVPRSKKFVH